MAADSQAKIGIMITEPQPGAADNLRAMLSETSLGTGTSDSVQIIGVARDGLEAAQMAVQLTPDVMLLHEQLPGMSGYEATRMISLAAPDVACVILLDRARIGEESLARALRVGARAVAPEDATTEMLTNLLSDLSQIREGRQEPEYELITDPERMPVTIAITGAKGGIGKTTIAVNLAISFARRHPGQVALVDFYGQYGNIPLMLDVNPLGDIGMLVDFANELDISLIEKNLTTHPDSGLQVLAGTPQNGGFSGRFSPEEEVAFLADLVGLMRRHYRFLFFDVPPLLGGASEYIYSRSQYIMLVTGLMDLTTVRDTGALYNQLLDMHLSPERIKIIVNRVSKAWALTIEDLEQSIGTKVAMQLPDDSTTALAGINEGIPLVISRGGSQLGRSIQDLVDFLEKTMAAERS